MGDALGRAFEVRVCYFDGRHVPTFQVLQLRHLAHGRLEDPFSHRAVGGTPRGSGFLTSLRYLHFVKQSLGLQDPSIQLRALGICPQIGGLVLACFHDLRKGLLSL